MLGLTYLSINEAEADAFGMLLSSYLPPEITRSGGIGVSVDRALLSLDDLASPDVALRRAKHFGLADQGLLEERVLLRRDGQLVIAGLRFKKLNVDFPFVQVCANFRVERDDLALVKGLVAKAYAPLSPRGITLRHPPNLFSSESHEMWSHIVFGEAKRISGSSFPAAFLADWSASTDFYPEYEREFRMFLAENPDKDAYLSVEDEADLKKAASDDLLMSLRDECGWAGLIAAKPRDLYGLPCAYIFEIFLAKRVRGRGMGRLLQARFISEVSARFSHLFGHIDNSNKPSLQTALSLGRRVVETEYFFPFD